MNTLTTQILQKFALLLQLAGNEATEKLNTELAKIIPIDTESALVDLRSSFWFSEEKNAYLCQIYIVKIAPIPFDYPEGQFIDKVKPYIYSQTDIFSKLTKILEILQTEDLERLKQELDKILNLSNEPIKLVFYYPPMVIAPKTAAFIFNFIVTNQNITP